MRKKFNIFISVLCFSILCCSFIYCFAGSSEGYKFNDISEEITTERLILTPINDEDIDILADYLLDYDVTKYLEFSTTISYKTKEEAINFFKKSSESGNAIEYTIKLKDTKPIPGTFIGSNGISSIFGEKTKFQWIVPSAKNSSYGNTDPRSTGGIFYIEVPFNNDQSQTVGLRVIGFKGADGAPQSSAGIQINTGSGWHKIDFDNEGILRISD